MMNLSIVRCSSSPLDPLWRPGRGYGFKENEEFRVAMITFDEIHNSNIYWGTSNGGGVYERFLEFPIGEWEE